MAILASPCNLDAYFPAYCLQQLRGCGPNETFSINASPPCEHSSASVPPRYPKATAWPRIRHLILHDRDWLCVCYIRGLARRSIKQSIMQSTKTCSPVAPSAFDRRNTTRLNLFHLAGYSSNLQVYVNRQTGNRKLSEWQPLLAAKPRTNHLAFAFEAGLVSM